MSPIRIPLQRSICSGPALSVVAGVLAGGSWIAIGLAGLFLLRKSWSAYAVTEPTNAYNFAMLLSRLTLASVCSIASGFLAVTTAKQNRKAAWWLGALLLLGSSLFTCPLRPSVFGRTIQRGITQCACCGWYQWQASVVTRLNRSCRERERNNESCSVPETSTRPVEVPAQFAAGKKAGCPNRFQG
jgi:drug/metabolite transporter superfamily protein YnfA